MALSVNAKLEHEVAKLEEDFPVKLEPTGDRRHLAFALKHSLAAERYYKSRAVLFARSGSVFA